MVCKCHCPAALATHFCLTHSRDEAELPAQGHSALLRKLGKVALPLGRLSLSCKAQIRESASAELFPLWAEVNNLPNWTERPLGPGSSSDGPWIQEEHQIANSTGRETGPLQDYTV